MKAYGLFFFLVILSISTGHSNTDFTYEQARQYFENIWNSGCLKMPIGRIIAVNSDNQRAVHEQRRDGSKHIIPIRSFHYIESLATQGILNVETIYTEPKGVWQEVQVDVTPMGDLRILEWGIPQETGWLCVKWGSSQLATLERNDLICKGQGIYRLIELTSLAEWTPEYVLWEETKGEMVSNHRKSIVLIKYDPLVSNWQLIVHDTANFSDEFKTQNVAIELERNNLGYCQE